MQTRGLRFHYYMRRSFLERHLVGFIFQHKLQWGYWIWGTKPWKSSQSFYSHSLALNYRSLFRESDSLWHLSWLQWVVLVQRKWCRLFVPLLNALLQMSTQRVLLTIIRYRINIVASILFPIPFGYYGPSSFLGLKHMLRFDLSIVRLLRP